MIFMLGRLLRLLVETIVAKIAACLQGETGTILTFARAGV